MARLGKWTDLVREVWGAPNGLAALALLVRYIFETGGEPPVRALRALMAGEVGAEAEEAIVTYAEQLRLEGESRGERRMLLRQLRRRFGEVPQIVVDRVNAAELDQIEVWGDRVLTAATLDEVFGEAAS